ncbi:GNAT family N-acetyltransferase [Agromyces sp. LHK192]|uniref:GNAT family N-acetyltransferase n=1 Tax=Agromyces sp. LHK192 TaxID=2498704 RepID=UPI000FDC386B|nr:GNAT family N-acetyltransferase [Agromyces sp. LHK192]
MHTTARPTANDAATLGDLVTPGHPPTGERTGNRTGEATGAAGDAIRTGAHGAASLAGPARRMADEALAAAGIRMLDAHDRTAAEQVESVLSDIWGRDDGMIDPALLVAMAHAGNLVALVSAGDAPIGAAVGFCGPPGAPFHSHIVGLLPEAVGAGRGRAVKLAQRAWCLERGIDEMTWTFDPLVARNAYFNLRRLGATALEYLPDFYGVMTDAINAGQHSDRVLIRWDLAQEPPSAEATRVELPLDAVTAAVADLDGEPTPYVAPAVTAVVTTVAVPEDIERLRRADPDAARRWRTETRAAFLDLLGSGWAITGFTRSSRYVLRRANPAAMEGSTAE